MAGSMDEMNQGMSVLPDETKQLTMSFGALREDVFYF